MLNVAKAEPDAPPKRLDPDDAGGVPNNPGVDVPVVVWPAEDPENAKGCVFDIENVEPVDPPKRLDPEDAAVFVVPNNPGVDVPLLVCAPKRGVDDVFARGVDDPPKVVLLWKLNGDAYKGHI